MNAESPSTAPSATSADAASGAPMSPARRRAIAAGVAGLGLLGGLGVAWWRHGPGAGGGSAPVAGGGTADALWQLQFDTPQGTPLAMAGLRGKPLVVNFWATWCPPCVEEMPLLDAFFRKNSAKGWQVVGLAIDQPSAVRAFLKKTPVAYPIGFAGLEGTDLGRNLGNKEGGLPFTVLIGPSGAVAQRRMGRLSPGEITAWPTQINS